MLWLCRAALETMGCTLCLGNDWAMRSKLIATGLQALDLASKVADDDDLSQHILHDSVCRHLVQELISVLRFLCRREHA